LTRQAFLKNCHYEKSCEASQNQLAAKDKCYMTRRLSISSPILKFEGNHQFIERKK